MSKIDINEVAEVIKTFKIEPSVAREILEELNSRAEAKESDKAEPTPRGKQQYVVVISDPEGKLKQDMVGWVVQLPESASPHSVIDRVMKAAHDFNASKKGRLLPVKLLGEAFESVARKWFKNYEVAVKTKTAIYIVRTDNKLTEAPSV